MRNWLTSNWQVKLLSLAIAVALWVFVVGQEKSEIILRMPVETTNIPKGMTVVGDPPDEVEVKVRGPRSLIRIAASQPVIRVLDLSKSKPGELIFRVLPSDFKLPPGVQIVRINPASIRIELAETASKDLPVRPVLPGRPAEGFRLGEVVIEPDKVRASGLAADVAELEKWVWTQPIDVNGISKTLTVEVPVRLVWTREPVKRGRVLISPRQVRVVVPVIPNGGEPPKRSGGVQSLPSGAKP